MGRAMWPNPGERALPIPTSSVVVQVLRYRPKLGYRCRRRRLVSVLIVIFPFLDIGSIGRIDRTGARRALSKGVRRQPE